MRSSSHLKDPCTQVPIKVQHREAKRRIRRRRVDLECGCSYYLSINCHNHGFSHRGTHHCSSSKEWRLYLEGSKSPLFQNPQPRQPSIHDEHGHNNTQDPFQLQPTESSGNTQVFSNLPNLDDLTPSDWSFLKGIQNPSPQVSQQSRCNLT
ncbi:transcription activator protein [Cotton leaf curl Alabad virus]|uniref:Transcriptional activator protein n=2 Tax=Begomovirus TaxID=10814 RepID=K4HXW0_9GEMI|nr:transcription activator protein [Cotton leaf curl Allahabad virus [India:Karnal:OY77:2005]]AFU61927.1 transcription activator protein [Bhendi yellow vein mosaic virus]